MTFALRISVALDAPEAEHTFVAQYDVDKITTALHDTTVHIPQTQLDRVVRNANSPTKTLFLGLEQPCPLWCPRLARLTPKPEPSSRASFDELAQLARATEVHIVFDYNWLHKGLQEAITRLVQGKLKLTGHPCDYLAQDWKRADTTIFDTADAAAPPAYADAINKRTRPGSSSASPSPPSKRILLDQLQAQAASPTELATSPPADETSFKSHPIDSDYQTWAISQVVRRHLSATIKEVLPDLLPGLLPSLFALPSSFSSHSEDSDSSQTPQPPKLTALGAALVPHVFAHMQPQLQKMLRQAVSYEEDRRQEAALEFEEDVENYKADMYLIKEDGVEALQKEAGYALDEVRENGYNLIEELDEGVDAVRVKGADIVDAVCRKLDSFEEKKLNTVAVAFLVAQEMRKYENSGKVADWRHLKQTRGRSRQRAGKGGYRGLGERWRQAPFLP